MNRSRLFFALIVPMAVIWSALAIGKPATQPAPTTAPLAVTQPATHFPTPAELVAQLKKKQGEVAKQPKVAYFDLSQPLAEKPADFSWFGGDTEVLTLRDLLGRLDQAKADKDLRAVLISLSNTELNLSQAMEVRDALTQLRHAGKRTFVYADAYDTDTYVAASGATDICLLSGGEIELPGVGFETMFAKGLLDKVGVNADYVQIGEYKGADEEYTRTQASDELRGELNRLADSLYNHIIDTISVSRNLPAADVKTIIDDALINGKAAKDRGLVDHLVEMDGLKDLLQSELGQKPNLLVDYGQSAKQQIDFSSPFAFFSLLARRPEVSTRQSVALIYAEGVIVDGPSGGGLLQRSENIGSDDMRTALRTALKDDLIKAVVIRIDSPGGSALASEVMWQSVRRVSKTKPVIISVGSMAASGGYYLASGGDEIFADPSAIVGSIGVVGGKFVLQGLYTKLGLTTENFSRGKNADLFSSSTEWTDGQRRMVTNMMHDTYVQFTERVMTTRKGKIKDIDAVARGRIFMAKQAKDLGMVDEIGGLQDALAYAAGKVNLPAGTYDVRVLPAPRTFADLFNGESRSSSLSPLSPAAALNSTGILSALPAAARALVMRQLTIMQLIDKHHVALIGPVLDTPR